MAEAIPCPVASNLLSKLGECLFAPIGRQFGYVLCYKSYVNDLKNGVKELETARERVQHDVQDAKNNGKPIHTDVDNWLKSVKEEIEKADKLLKCGECANNACFRGWLPNPVVRHPIGRKVMKITKVIQGLQAKSQNNNFQKVYHESPPIGIVPATTSIARFVDNKEDVLESRAKIMEDVIKAVVDDKVYVIGVWGVGGVGKSKLLEDVERQIKEQKLYDVVAKANISRNPDLKRIQGEIAYALGLKLMDEETTYGRANRLRERLESDNKKNILIILDNLWEKLELKEVGIPCGDDNKVRGCKLLLTSRYRDVLCIDMCSDQQFQLNELEDGEAQRLFERIVGDRVKDPEFTSLVKRVVKNCGGLPLLIVSSAKRLKPGDLAAWRHASTYIDVSNVKSLVEQNYNDLKDERIKSLFLICALDSGIILLRDSFIYCMGLGLFKKFSNTIEDARDRLIMDLHRLQDFSLLLDSNDPENFRMHDIFVDAAISIFSTEWNALVGRKDFGFKKWSTHELRKCIAISFSWVGIDELPENLDCPNLRMLLLLERNPFLKIPDSFFESMEKLQVLDLTGLSFTSLPSSIKFLGNLKSLSLDQCHLEDVTVLGKLKGLQFLSFFKSAIPKLPKELGELTELRFLDLTKCIELKVIEPGVLGSLVNLEELYMEDSFDQWEAEYEAPPSNASLAELKSMTNLSNLSIAIPQSVNLSTGLPFGKLNKYKIQIGDVWHWSGKYQESTTLKLKLDSRNLPLEEWLSKCSQKPQDLHLDGLQNGIFNIHDLCVEGFQELKHLHVENSSSFQYVVGSTENVQCTAFTRLESLFLENLNNLKKICRGSLSLESFNKLKIVKVGNCGEIKHLFPFSMKRIISQLEEIEISNCCLMQQILTYGETNEDGDEIDYDTKVTSCKLRRLTLRNLPKMTSFCKTADHLFGFFDGQQVSLPWLESLTLSALPILKEIWNSQFPSDVSNLKFLKVKDCAFLMSIFPSNLLIKLHTLEAIIIERCQVIRKLFDLEGLTSSGDVEILSRLTTLTLSDLPRLEHICNKNPREALYFRNLRVLKVQGCENLRFIFSSSVVKALQQIKEIKIARCKLLEEIMNVQEEESKKAASMHTLEFPLLSSLSLEELPNLITFSHGTHRIHCPTLTRLRISKCPKMMTFSSFEGKQQTTTNAGLQQAFGGANSSMSLSVLFDQNILFPSLEELTVMSCGLMKIWHNELSKESFRKLASITIRDCENLSHIFPSNIIEVFHSLKMIEVVNCTSLESLIEHVAVNTKKRPKSLVFLNLKEVKLWDLLKLDALVTSSSQATLSLPSLTTVSLRNCHSLRYLFTCDTSGTLDKLEMLDVSDCNKMQEVVAMEESEERKLKAVKFSRLQILKLCSLESLISFSSGSCAFEFPSLTNLSILECTKLKAFILRLPAPRVEMTNEGTAGSNESPHCLFDNKVLFLSLEKLTLVSCGLMKIWHNELSEESFRKLAFITIRDCENLSHIFSSNIIEVFQSLKMIEVVNCTSLESLIEHVAVNTKKRPKSLVFLNLKEVKLWDLPRLDALVTSRSQATLSLPSLTIISLCNCHNLRYLFPYDTSGTLDKLEMLDVFDCNKMQEVVAIEESEEQKSKAMKFSCLQTLKLCSLKSLISFSSGSCAFEFPSLRNLSILECTELQAFILRRQKPRVEMINEGSTSSDKSSHSLFDEKVLFPSLEELKLLSMCQLKRIWHNQLHGQSFCELASLTVELCENLSHVFPSNSMDRLQSLSKIEVVGCPSLEALFEPVSLSSEERQKPLELSALKKMKLLNLPRLTDILKGDCEVTLTFPSLMEVNVKCCHSLSYLFSSTTAETLHELVVLDISCCNNLRDIIVMEEGKGKTTETFEFRHLTKLKLGDLKSLICFSSKNCAGDDLYPLFDEKFAFPKLEELHIEGVQQEELWNNKIPMESFCCLKVLKVKQCHNLMNVIPSFMSERLLHYMKSLTVEECPRLRNLFTMFMAKSLGQLQYLGLSGCGEMEYIVAKQEEKPEEATDKIVIPQLVTLYLHNMPKLKSFCQDKHISEWPSLKEFTIEDCKAMKVILGDASCRKLEGSDPTHQPFLLIEKLMRLQNLEVIMVERCQLIRDVFDLEELTTNGDVKILWQLTRLTLSGLPRLECIWNKNPRKALCFQNLKALKVRNCESLRFLFPSSMAKALMQIKEIEIASCALMEEIMYLQEEELEEAMTTDTVEFPLLTSLSLEELPNLKTFSYGKYYIHCPSLTRLTISGCPKMMTFSSFKGRQQSMTADIGLQQASSCINSSLSLPSFFNEKVLFPSLEELKLSSMYQLKRIWHNQLQGQFFYKLASLTVELCENLSHVFPSNSMDMLQSLNKIKAIGCPSLEALFEPISLSAEKRQKPLVLPALRELTLLNLSRLRDILKSDCKVTLAFPSLMEVNVRHCHSLSILFSSATAKTLHELAVLDISYCNNLRGIIAMEEGKGKTVEAFKFPHLTKLKLDDLKSLICFNLESCAGDGLHPLFDEKLALPKLEVLHIEGVQHKEIWNDKIHVESFCLLKVLKVKQCHNLVNVIPSSMWKRLLHCMESLTVEKCQRLRNLFKMSMEKSLGKLQYLGLGGCGEIEYIVAKEEEKLEEVANKIIIPQLVTLYLHNMPKLKSFYEGKHISEWPSLKEFIVEDCKAVKVILGDVSCRKLEGSVPTHQPLLLVEKVEFPGMELMKISHMDDIEKIWLDDLNSNAFGKLKTLVLEYCEKLVSIFSSYNMLTQFQNLEKIIVTDCGSLEVVFQGQEFEFSKANSTNNFQLRELILTRLSKMKHVWSGLPQGGLTFGRLQYMEVVKCESLKSLFLSSMAKSMTHLKELLVLDCGVEDIIMEEDGVGMSANDLFFPRLIDLRLLELPKLRSFYRNSHTSAWPLLKQLRVRHCGKMRSSSFACESQSYQGAITSENQYALFSFEKVISHLEGLTLTMEDVMMMMPQHYVFHNLKELDLACYHDENVAFPSNFLLHRFPNLEELGVICSSFEEIFPEDSSGHGGATPYELTNMEKPLQALRNLWRLDLKRLCNLKQVWKDGSLMTEILKQIEVLWIVECPRLPIVLPSPISFQRLTYLGMEDCNGLVHLGTCSAVTSLGHLTQLILINCGAMEDVVTDDGNGEEDISFPELEELILDGLPSLESFSPMNRAFSFPSLVRIVITKCPKMNIFCKGALRTPKLDEVLLSEEDDEGHWEGDLNTTIQTLSTLNDPQRIQ